MTNLSFDDIRRYWQCPFAYLLDSASGEIGLTLRECMDISVREAIVSVGWDRILGRNADRDRTMAAFWDRWDTNFPRVRAASGGTERMEYIKTGERCISNFVEMTSKGPSAEILAADVHGTLELPGDESIDIYIDEIGRRGSTLCLCRYVTDQGIGSKQDLAADPEMRMSALWASRNLPNAKNLVVQWRMLMSGVEIESKVPMGSLADTSEEVSEAVASIRRGGDVLPNESDRCRECRHIDICPRFKHEMSLKEAGSMSADEGVKLVDEYAELDEKIQALKARQEMMEARREEVGRRLIGYADANGFIAVRGHECKALVRHEKKAELPKDKTDVVRTIRDIGMYEELSGINYSRLRADIVKGAADPRIAKFAKIVDVDKIYLRRDRPERPGTP